MRQSPRFDLDRRALCGAGALAIAAFEFSSIGAARAQASAGATFSPLKQIDAGDLNVGYPEAGPPDGSPVILVHIVAAL
jgi:hypothetical protein